MVSREAFTISISLYIAIQHSLIVVKRKFCTWLTHYADDVVFPLILIGQEMASKSMDMVHNL